MGTGGCGRYMEKVTFYGEIEGISLEQMVRGKTAYGCSEYKNGCTFRLDYATYGNNLTDEELGTVISKLKSI